MSTLAKLLHRLLELISVGLLVALALLVVVAVVMRYVFNDSLAWYDEVASVMLAWITYFGAALAAQKRAHMGFGSLVLKAPMAVRYALFVVAELVVYTVFIALAWAGWKVLVVMEGMSLESLPWASLALVQSIVPVGCGLIVLAQFASTPLALQRLRSGKDADAEEVDLEIARAQAEWSKHPNKLAGASLQGSAESSSDDDEGGRR